MHPTSDPKRATPPSPARVRYNDWPAVALPPADAFTPALAVSVVIPCFDAAEPLARTIAALERQTWPCDLLEIIIVDDGSHPPLAPPQAPPFAVRMIRREERGFSLAAARNAGARAASGDILVFLDADLIAEAGLIATHARWHHAVGDAFTIGFRAHVSVAGITPQAIRACPATIRDLLAGRPFDPPWNERLMIATADLTAPREDLFRIAGGGNFGISRALFAETGGFDESFTCYGGEDIEFAWRVQVRGGLLVPVREAFAWHQGRWGENRAAKRRALGRQRGKLADLIAVPGFRRAVGRRHHTVPRHAVLLEPGAAPVGRIIRAARDLLDDPAGDVALCVEVPTGGGPEALAELRRAFDDDPRVRVASGQSLLEAFPHTPLHIVLPAEAVRPGVVRALSAALGRRVAVTVSLGDGTEASVARTWALHRARRAGIGVSAFGDTGRVVLRQPRGLRRFGERVAAFGNRLVPGAGAPAWVRRAMADCARVVDEARHVRNGRAALRFLRWLWAGFVWRLRHGR